MILRFLTYVNTGVKVCRLTIAYGPLLRRTLGK